MGQAFVDNPRRPTAYCLVVGPFWYCAGDARGVGGRQFLSHFPAYNLLMPSPPAWVEAAQALYGPNLHPMTRYSFSPAGLTLDHLTALLASSPHQARLVALDVELTTRLAAQPDSYLDLADFHSPADFVERGLGFAALNGDQVMGVAYASLVCNQGIEVSLFVAEPYRRQGVATALGGRLLLECLRQDRRPNWDAANPESGRLAEKLGYTFTATYTAYYHTGRPHPN